MIIYLVAGYTLSKHSSSALLVRTHTKSTPITTTDDGSSYDANRQFNFGRTDYRRRREWSDLTEFVHLFDSIILETKSSERFYPTERIHEECGWSHEGLEFIRGLMYALAEWLESDSDFQAVLKKHKIAKDRAFQE